MKPRWIWGYTLLLALIGTAAVAHRMAALGDGAFAQHPLLTIAHILPGLLYLLLAPLQFWPGLRARRPRLHRWMGRVVVADGAVVGITAVVMSPRMAIGGAVESAATMTFGLLFLFALGRAFVEIRRGRVARHREWMIRAFAIGSAVAFIRPIVGVFFATSRLTHLTPHDFFGPAFWIGFIVQTAAAEIHIRHGRKAPAGLWTWRRKASAWAQPLSSPRKRATSDWSA